MTGKDVGDFSTKEHTRGKSDKKKNEIRIRCCLTPPSILCFFIYIDQRNVTSRNHISVNEQLKISCEVKPEVQTLVKKISVH